MNVKLNNRKGDFACGREQTASRAKGGEESADEV